MIVFMIVTMVSLNILPNLPSFFEHESCYDSLGFCYQNYDLEIVGNIYDNPDLI